MANGKSAFMQHISACCASLHAHASLHSGKNGSQPLHVTSGHGSKTSSVVQSIRKHGTAQVESALESQESITLADILRIINDVAKQVLFETGVDILTHPVQQYQREITALMDTLKKKPGKKPQKQQGGAGAAGPKQHPKTKHSANANAANGKGQGKHGKKPGK